MSTMIPGKLYRFGGETPYPGVIYRSDAVRSPRVIRDIADNIVIDDIHPGDVAVFLDFTMIGASQGVKILTKCGMLGRVLYFENEWQEAAQQ